MRIQLICLVLLVCSSCAQIPRDIPPAPQGRAQAVVFDIDGTLTPTVTRYQDVRPDAAKVARLFASHGYKVFYVSARVPFLQKGVSDWLTENGFPSGSINLIKTSEYLSSHAEFKKTVLQDVKTAGWNIMFAYGDSETDFEAYQAAGIPKRRVYALLREEDESCQQGAWSACLKNWSEHMETIENRMLACKESEINTTETC